MGVAKAYLVIRLHKQKLIIGCWNQMQIWIWQIIILRGISVCFKRK